MVCPECGKNLPQNAVKCNKCGKVFKEIKKNTETDEFLKKEKEKSQKLREKKLKAKENSEKNKKILKILIPCVAVALAVAVAVAMIVNGINKKRLEDIKKNHPEKLIEYTYTEADDSSAIMKLGDINIDYKEYEFFYRQSFSNVQNNSQLQFNQFVAEKLGDKFDESNDYYAEYFGEFLKVNPSAFDFKKPITQQTTTVKEESGKELSWQEFIRNDAIATMTNYRTKFDLAKDAGIELTDDIRYQVYSHIEGLRNAIKGSGYQNLTQYLQLLFGQGCDEEFFKNELIREYTASKYDTVASLQKMDSYSKDNVKTIYETNSANYDFIDLSVFETTGKDAKETADKIFKEIKSANEFTNAVQKYMGDTSDRTYLPTVPNQYVIEQYSEKLAQWAYSKERKAGDKKIFDSANGCFIAVINKPAYTTMDNVSYREIVISKTDANGNPLTGSALDEAKKQAQAIFDEIKKNKVDENDFACTALIKSQSSTASSGGLVPVATADQLNENLMNWVSDKNRKNGDIEFIETETGYAIVYFLKNYGEYWNYAVRATVSSGDITDENEKIKNSKYNANYDFESLLNAESTMNSDIERIYFGIGA